MGCLQAKAWRIGGVGTAEASRIGGIKNASASRIGGVKASCYLLCEVVTKQYLRVKPKETMWIDVNTTAGYSVLSSGEWTLV